MCTPRMLAMGIALPPVLRGDIWGLLSDTAIMRLLRASVNDCPFRCNQGSFPARAQLCYDRDRALVCGVPQHRKGKR